MRQPGSAADGMIELGAARVNTGAIAMESIRELTREHMCDAAARLAAWLVQHTSLVLA
jgi:hypothetical protein